MSLLRYGAGMWLERLMAWLQSGSWREGFIASVGRGPSERENRFVGNDDELDALIERLGWPQSG